jgi:holo-[acyl-carrier protein] synthase
MKSILGVGCDLCEISRIKEAMQKNPESFLNKILTHEEMLYCQSYKDSSSHVAARFAAKEAVSKSIGVGIGKDLGFHDVMIVLDEKKKPHVKLSSTALERFPHIHFEISLSHTESLAMAFVIAYT